MDSIIIFNTPIILVLIIFTPVMYFVPFLLEKYVSKHSAGEKNRSVIKISGLIFPILSVVLHLAVFVLLLIYKAPPQEMLFFITLSALCALAASDKKPAESNGEEGEKK